MLKLCIYLDTSFKGHYFPQVTEDALGTYVLDIPFLSSEKAIEQNRIIY